MPCRDGDSGSTEEQFHVIALTPPWGRTVSGLRVWRHADAKTSSGYTALGTGCAGPGRPPQSVTGKARLAGTLGQLAPLPTEVTSRDPSQKVLKNRGVGVAALTLSWKHTMLSGLESKRGNTEVLGEAGASEPAGRGPTEAGGVGVLQDQRQGCGLSGSPAASSLWLPAGLWAKASAHMKVRLVP